MKEFGGPVLFLDRNNISANEIIPNKIFLESSVQDLKPFLFDNLKLNGFDLNNEMIRNAKVIVTRKNFGHESSNGRDHAVWALKVNGINVVVAESFDNVFQRSMVNL